MYDMENKLRILLLFNARSTHVRRRVRFAHSALFFHALGTVDIPEGVLRMNITICDDQKNELESIKQIVTEYAKAHSELLIEISCFLNPLDMLDGINKNGVPDIALLDICMPGVLGTEIAKEIQSKSEDNTDIVFLTTSHDFAVEAFALHVNDYLTKPFTKERLADTLDRLIEKRKRRTESDSSI